MFPGCKLSGVQNCATWMDYMLAGEPRTLRPARILTGLKY